MDDEVHSDVKRQVSVPFVVHLFPAFLVWYVRHIQVIQRRSLWNCQFVSVRFATESKKVLSAFGLGFDYG